MDGAALEVQKRAPCGAGQGMHHPGSQTCSQGAIVVQLTPAKLHIWSFTSKIKHMSCSGTTTSPFACVQDTLVVGAVHQSA